MQRLAALTLLLFACSGPSVDAPLPPSDGNDPDFVVSGLRDWYLVGNDLTPGHESLALEVEAPEDVRVIDLWVGDEPGERLERVDGVFRIERSIADLAAGTHRLLLAADGAERAFARFGFERSHPLYVVVSTDWDTADTPDENLARHDTLHANHPDLLITHFIGPYTFTDPEVAPSRVDEIVAWAQGMRDGFGDEIGLHIHPYCNFVDTTSVTCREEPVFYENSTRGAGYTVHCSAYTAEEFRVLAEASVELFEANGLGTPTSFRAGGWTADASTLQGLADAGFVADTSAVNWARLEEWEGAAGASLFEWNRDHWAGIGDTSQPYYPSAADAAVPGSPHIPILEVPDNGALVDYVLGSEMREIFAANRGEGPLLQPRVFSVGFHPINYSESFAGRMEFILERVDTHLASEDLGPVVYARLSDLALVWPAP